MHVQADPDAPRFATLETLTISAEALAAALKRFGALGTDSVATSEALDLLSSLPEDRCRVLNCMVALLHRAQRDAEARNRLDVELTRMRGELASASRSQSRLETALQAGP